MSFARFRSWATDVPGSTRSVGLMRIGLVLLGWAELGSAVQPHKVHPLLSVFFYVATLLSLAGFRARGSTFAAGASYLVVITQVPNTMLHHTYLLAVSAMLLALTPCGGSFSVDRVRAIRRAERAGEGVPAEEGNLWALRLIALELSAVFFWGAYDKLTFGTQHLQTAFPTGDRIEQILAYYYSGLPVQAPLWLEAIMVAVGSGVVVFEMAAAFLLWSPRYRMRVLAACFVMTSCFQVVLDMRAFGLLSYVLYLAFVPPEVVHQVVDDLVGRAQSSPPRPPPSGPLPRIRST